MTTATVWVIVLTFAAPNAYEPDGFSNITVDGAVYATERGCLSDLTWAMKEKTPQGLTAGGGACIPTKVAKLPAGLIVHPPRPRGTEL